MKTRGNPEVVIVASAFGVDTIRRDGHAAWARITADAGAAGFEVRRELFPDEETFSLNALRSLGQQIEAAALWLVYSTPVTIFDESGTLDDSSINQSIEESVALGARIVKFQLGGDTDGGLDLNQAALTRLIEQVECSKAQVVVENGQLRAGGTIQAFEQLFDALAAHPHPLSMTFDTANWLWAQQDPMEAARRLTAYVAYIHCKAAKGEGTRRVATAPDPADTHFHALLDLLPCDVPRGIEFPFNADHLAADAAHYVTQIAFA